MEWKDVHTQQDLDFLLRECCDFHDSCVVELNYKTGSVVDENLYMGMGTLQEHTLSLVLQRQIRPVTVELCFSGVRKFYVEGWQNYHFCEISSCHLKFHRDLIEGEDKDLIVWSDYEDFDPKLLSRQDLLDNISESFIIASGLKWRFIGE